MMDSITSDVHPHIIRILEEGVRFDRQLDPVLVAQVCRLNMSQFPGVEVTGEYNQLIYICHGRRIARIIWFADGVEFVVCWSSPLHLTEMIGQVLHTIEEMSDG